MSNPPTYYSNKTSYKFNERNRKNKRKTGTAEAADTLLCTARVKQAIRETIRRKNIDV